MCPQSRLTKPAQHLNTKTKLAFVALVALIGSVLESILGNVKVQF